MNGTSYGPQELERTITVPDRNRKMVEEVERVAAAGKVLVYAITKRHAAEIARYFNALRPSLRGRFAEATTTDSGGRRPRYGASSGRSSLGSRCPYGQDTIPTILAQH